MSKFFSLVFDHALNTRKHCLFFMYSALTSNLNRAKRLRFLGRNYLMNE